MTTNKQVLVYVSFFTLLSIFYKKMSLLFSMSGDYCFLITFKPCRKFEYVMTYCTHFQKDTQLTIDKSGLTVSQLSPARNLVTKMYIPAEYFNTYEVSETITIGIDVSTFVRMYNGDTRINAMYMEKHEPHKIRLLAETKHGERRVTVDTLLLESFKVDFDDFTENVTWSCTVSSEWIHSSMNDISRIKDTIVKAQLNWNGTAFSLSGINMEHVTITSNGTPGETPAVRVNHVHMHAASSDISKISPMANITVYKHREGDDAGLLKVSCSDPERGITITILMLANVFF